MVLRLKEEHMKELLKLQDSHKTALRELSEQHNKIQNQLKRQIESLKTSGFPGEGMSQQLEDVISIQDDLIKEVRRRTKTIYDKFSRSHTQYRPSVDFDKEELLYVDFMTYFIHHLHKENGFLLEKLGDAHPKNMSDTSFKNFNILMNEVS